MTAENDLDVRPVLWNAAKRTVGTILAIGTAWSLASAQGAVAPLSITAVLAILGFGLWAGARHLSAFFEKEEDSAGETWFGGPYVRAPILDAILGAALGMGFLSALSHKMQPQPDSAVQMFMCGGLGFALALVGIIQCAGRRRDRPLLAAIDDACNGAFGGVIAGSIAYVFHTTKAAVDLGEFGVWATLGAATGAVVNLIRKSAQDRKRLLK